MIDWEKCKRASKGAALTETSSKKEETQETVTKQLKNLPKFLLDEYKRQHAAGLTVLNFTSFTYEAIKEKLERNKKG